MGFPCPLEPTSPQAGPQGWAAETEQAGRAGQWFREKDLASGSAEHVSSRAHGRDHPAPDPGALGAACHPRPPCGLGARVAQQGLPQEAATPSTPSAEGAARSPPLSPFLRPRGQTPAAGPASCNLPGQSGV